MIDSVGWVEVPGLVAKVVSLLGIVFVLGFRNASLSWIGVLMTLAACFAS
ncbi:hypothetical protein [Brevibacterium aurantiacum]|nr:hypothetical protein [Brevibacterium aurantiacum]